MSCAAIRRRAASTSWASASGLVDLDAIITGGRIEPGDALIGMPSSGIHSNGLSLARSVLTDLDEQIGDTTVGDMLLEPTVIYVQAIRELLELGRGRARPRAHHRGRLPEPAAAGGATPATGSTRRFPCRPCSCTSPSAAAWRTRSCTRSSTWAAASAWSFRAEDAEAALELLGRHHPGSALIGQATTATGVVELPKQGLIGRRGEGFTPAS